MIFNANPAAHAGRNRWLSEGRMAALGWAWTRWINASFTRQQSLPLLVRNGSGQPGAAPAAHPDLAAPALSSHSKWVSSSADATRLQGRSSRLVKKKRGIFWGSPLCVMSSSHDHFLEASTEHQFGQQPSCQVCIGLHQLQQEETQPSSHPFPPTKSRLWIVLVNVLLLLLSFLILTLVYYLFVYLRYTDWFYFWIISGTILRLIEYSIGIHNE